MKSFFKIISATALLSLTLMLAVSGCGMSSSAIDGAAAPAATSSAEASTVRLGYFDNATHGPALVGLQQGTFAKDLGPTTLSPQIFSAGPAVIEALSAGAIDAAYIGPSPAINSFIKSGGASLVVVSGVTRGGAALVVREGITTAADLKGAVIASPQLGNTQDVALRSWLAKQGFATSTDGAGDVKIQPSENAQTLNLFNAGSIDGAWLPEPWASRLIIDAGAHELVNEADLWPGGKFPSTVLVVSHDFFIAYPATVAKLVAANDQVITWMTAHLSEVGPLINAQLKADTGKSLSDAVLTRALSRLTFTVDPDAVAFDAMKTSAVSLKLAKEGSLTGLFQLDALNSIVKARGGDLISLTSSSGN